MDMGTVYHKLTSKIKTEICEYKDFRTSRHIVVFESDDWGSIRMSNRKDWESLRKMGYAVDTRPYEKYDTLESASDLASLFEVLCHHKGADGRHPIITVNMLMANPDFDRIAAGNFQDYYYEPIAETYTRYFGNASAMMVFRQGLDAGVIMPQFHGREHFNVSRWIKGLQSGDPDLLTAFRYNMCGIAPKDNPNKGNDLMKSLYAESMEEQSIIEDILKDGLFMFEQMWGFRSQSFVAPCYCWNSRIEEILKSFGTMLIQTSRAKKVAFRSPCKFFFSGERNQYRQTYSIRNCTFEPAIRVQDNSLDAIMNRVDYLFSKHKIVVFSTHRVNYVSGIDETNRTKTLELLDNLLKSLLDRYPDIEFKSSDMLIDIL